jgi:hypothetical protein
LKSSFWTVDEAQTYSNQGRAIPRLIVLYDSPQRLVEENDRRLDIDDEDGTVAAEITEECVNLFN